LSVAEVQKDSVLLSWEQPTNTGGCDITDYIIEKRDAKRNTWTPVDKVDGSTFSFNVLKLLEGNEYYFRVTAKNEIGASEPAEMDKGTVAKSPFGKRCFPNFLSMTQNFAADKICLDHI
jgi:titin